MHRSPCSHHGQTAIPRADRDPGPLFISASQRSHAEKAATPAYVFTVTGKNRKREREPKRRQEAEKSAEDKRKRSKKSKSIIADSDEDEDDGEVNKDREDRVPTDNDDSGDSSRDHGSANAVSTLQQAVSTSPRRTSTPSPPAASDAVGTSTATPPAPTTPPEEVEAEVTRPGRAEAVATLKLGLGKDSRTSQVVFDEILDAAFAVAGPEAMEDMLRLCQKWRDGLIYHTRQDLDAKAAVLRADCEGRLPDSAHKAAIVDVHVAAYWASADDADDFIRAIECRGRLADFWEAFQVLLQPCVKPNPGWKKRFGEVRKSRLEEANPGMDPRGKEYRKKARHLEHQLQYGERWGRLRREFGPGVFALLPSAVVTNRWVEQGLSATQFDAWLRLLKRRNPPDPVIVRQAWYLVDEALSGRPPPRRLRLEDTSLTDISRDYHNPAILQPLEDKPSGIGGDEDESLDRNGAFLDEETIT